MKRDQREKNWGASILANERDVIEEELQRKEEPHKRVAVTVVVDCTERRNWSASLAVTNLGFHVDLV